MGSMLAFIQATVNGSGKSKDFSTYWAAISICMLRPLFPLKELQIARSKYSKAIAIWLKTVRCKICTWALLCGFVHNKATLTKGIVLLFSNLGASYTPEFSCLSGTKWKAWEYHQYQNVYYLRYKGDLSHQHSVQYLTQSCVSGCKLTVIFSIRKNIFYLAEVKGDIKERKLWLKLPILHPSFFAFLCCKVKAVMQRDAKENCKRELPAGYPDPKGNSGAGIGSFWRQECIARSRVTFATILAALTIGYRASAFGHTTNLQISSIVNQCEENLNSKREDQTLLFCPDPLDLHGLDFLQDLSEGVCVVEIPHPPNFTCFAEYKSVMRAQAWPKKIDIPQAISTIESFTDQNLLTKRYWSDRKFHLSNLLLLCLLPDNLLLSGGGNKYMK